MKKKLITFCAVIVFSFLSFTASAQEGFLAEVRLFAGNFAPRGWAFCHGQILPISQNSALFSLLGTMYGGDGRTTFALPDLRGRVPVGVGNGPGLDPVKIGDKSMGDAVSKPPADNNGNKKHESNTVPTLGLHYIICM